MFEAKHCFLQALVFCPLFSIDLFLRLMLNVMALSYVMLCHTGKRVEVIILIGKNSNTVF